MIVLAVANSTAEGLKLYKIAVPMIPTVEFPITVVGLLPDESKAVMIEVLVSVGLGPIAEEDGVEEFQFAVKGIEDAFDSEGLGTGPNPKLDPKRIEDGKVME